MNRFTNSMPRVQRCGVLVLMLMLAPGTMAGAASPAIEAALAMPRTKPVHYVDAALALVDLGVPEKATAIADELVALSPNEDALAQLVESAGSARLLRLAREFPTTVSLVERAMTLAAARSTAPERLQKLAQRLTTGDLAEQQAALADLRQTGTAGVRFVIAAIADANNREAEARLREALVALEPESLPAIVGATADKNEAVATQSIYALGRLAQLGRLRSGTYAALIAVPALLDPAGQPAGEAARWSYQQIAGEPADPATAVRLLDSTIAELLAGSVPWRPDAEDRVAWLDEGEIPTDRAAVALAARLAADRARLTPGETAAQRRALRLAAEAGPLLIDTPLDVERFTTSELLSTLDEALVARQMGAAKRLCEALGQRGDRTALASVQGRPTPLAAALAAPSPAARFAALEAIMTLAPETPFAGSSGVAETLAYFAAASGKRRAVVATPNFAYSAEIAGHLLAAGIAATPTNRGSDLLVPLEKTPDVELALVDLAVLRPGARETLFRLRRLAGGAALPVAVLAPDGRLAEAQALAEEHDLRVIAVARPYGAASVSALAERLTGLRSAEAPTADERAQMATRARGWIAQIAANGPRFYQLRDSIPEITAALAAGDAKTPVAILATLADPASQRRLAAAASNELQPLADRQAAAEGFAESVSRFGLLLSEAEVYAQYQAYNQAATADEPIQRVLGSVLDTIETRRSPRTPTAP
ncbi:hypothetical protein [Botrimarina hoheduenensis]|uniref:Response regulatory domain-containing protein n=1 Tax=Botrimarina hoheduenensis TaxID=2528000 RepID=A0A5C5W9Z6_9BACT|nr:hypothetical protein [Botrimarina hoheduenensis]TWT46859.1 hypothetical protein Pla111_19610 [Botrimarina hoheduenensis]